MNAPHHCCLMYLRASEYIVAPPYRMRPGASAASRSPAMAAALVEYGVATDERWSCRLQVQPAFLTNFIARSDLIFVIVLSYTSKCGRDQDRRDDQTSHMAIS